MMRPLILQCDLLCVVNLEEHFALSLTAYVFCHLLPVSFSLHTKRLDLGSTAKCSK